MLRSAGVDIVQHPEDEVFVCRHVEIDPLVEPNAVYPASRPERNGA
jgi:tRNA (mo5U34)-methyltransferase